jgi:DNA-binding transcriptional LysR family regulator
MELRHLRYFVAIAEERGFTRAAERLWVTQSGLSQQILTLERELGVKLFERLSRGVELTDAGTIFLERARDALRAAEAANSVGRDIRAGLFGSIKLGVASGARWRWTSAVLQQLARECDGLELSVLEGYGGAVWNELRAGRLDAVIAPAGYASADLQRVSLGAEPWMVVISRSHDLAARSGPLSAADLEGQLIALTTHRDGAEYDRAVAGVLDRLDVRAQFIRAVPTPGLPGAVTNETALVLTTGPEVSHADAVVRSLPSAPPLEFVLLWRGQAISPAVTQLIRIAADYGIPDAPSPILTIAA